MESVVVHSKLRHLARSHLEAIAVKISRSASSVAREMLGNLHAMKEMAITLVCLQTSAQKVAKLQKLL
jgi:hypothetical protein